MADIIHLLPDSVANQIAAGEVIQRPSSVVKELMENAVDAGATSIDVFVTDAGRTCIQVIDDGKGMSETDARLAFERHATSKIRKSSDLYSLCTMGFRGEALPSIAAVSQVTLWTHAHDAELGTCLTIEGGKVLSQVADGCPAGSNFLVQNLFFNVPARRRFLKSNQTELSNIIQEFERISLVNPNIKFTFSHNEHVLSTYPASSVRQRISAIFGHNFGDNLLCVEVDTSLCKVSGFVGRPEAARKKGAHQFFFANGRYMRHPYFQKAVQNAFEGLIPPAEQVPFFLYIQVDPSTIDVNIHPTKTEIKFENEQAVWQILTVAVKEALGRFNAVPIIDFDTEGRPAEIPVYSPSTHVSGRSPQPCSASSYNPFADNSPKHSADATNWQKLYSDVSDGGHTVNGQVSLQMDELVATNIMERSMRHYQYRGQYIITETQAGLMVVEQHRAHIRILYDRYKRQLSSGHGLSQRLLFPEIVKLSVSDAALLEEIQEDLMNVGFDISPLGGGSYSVLGLPYNIETLDSQNLFDEMLSNLREGGQSVVSELQRSLANIMARNVAIPVGQELTQQEMEVIVSELLETENVNHTPDGSVITVFIEHEKLSDLFK